MNRNLAYASLLLLSLFAAGCPKRPTAPDYDSVRQRSVQSHQDLDQQKAPQEK
jgi:hypothetical protein